MQTTSFQSVVKELTDDQTPRVWSLLVTVFGELAQEKGARISGLLLRHMSERIGIKPEAMRVAIHRLRKDGWIDSQRTGRTSAYFLTEWGRAQSALASPRIYASHPAADNAWLVLTNPGQPQQIDDATGAWISANLLVTSDPPAQLETFVTPLDPDKPLPDWMTTKVCDAQTVQISQAFSTALITLQSRLDDTPKLSSLETAALRVLLVHSWRRIVLKVPVLPDYVFPKGWRGSICRDRVSTLLTQYPKQALGELEDAIASENGA
jgi:phenylacetic acid degradation operon negative regulatory protein